MSYVLSIGLITLLLLGYPVLAQENFGINVPFLTYHLHKDDQAYLQPNRLDSHAKFVLNIGAIAYYERFIFKSRLSIKMVQAAYLDCAVLLGGFTHIALRYKFIGTTRHELRAGFGPSLIYRQSWYRFPGYYPSSRYMRQLGDWQYAFTMLGGEIAYDYKISQRVSINANVYPALPDLLFFSVGIRYWISAIPHNSFWKEHPEKKKWFYKAGDLY